MCKELTLSLPKHFRLQPRPLPMPSKHAPRHSFRFRSVFRYLRYKLSAPASSGQANSAKESHLSPRPRPQSFRQSTDIVTCGSPTQMARKRLKRSLCPGLSAR